ncbi:MAG: glucosylceramidase [Saprospiraceae bacterium]|nr:glucosylceramidase [Saprospiraceae bacterium]
MLLNRSALYSWFYLLLSSLVLSHCTSPEEDIVQPPTTVKPVLVCKTSPDQVNLLYTTTVDFAAGKDDRFPVIQIDSTQQFQTVDGFGYTLTGGSAWLINRLGPSAREALLKELFGRGENSIGVSYLRISLGASDLSASVFSYNDLPAGQTDTDLSEFSLSQDTVDLIPVLKQILAIRPDLKIMASPWSAPVWMKTNGSSIGGNLQPQYYGVYAQYFVRYIQAMQANGIAIDAVTPQNEPQHGGNNPSMVMSAAQQADFVKNHLGPAFQAAGLSTKIIIWDHNCDNPAYPITILNDAAAKAFVHGSAFHLYAGDISALSQVRTAHPDRELYFTEQWTGSTSDFGGDLKWHLKNVIIGSMRNWSRVALEWNLANDPSFKPHTPGGCTQCKGALTIDDAGNITRNVSYYIVAHAAKFVPPGSVRIGSTLSYGSALHQVAFRTPEGKTALVVLNESNDLATFNIHYHGKWIVSSLYGGNAGTYVF